MGLLSFFKRGTHMPASPIVAEEQGGDVQRARTRARQRLIGAVVLVAIGVIGFPLVFETQPRPIAVDIPIEIPRKEGAPALVMPAARPVRAAPEAAAPSAPGNAPEAAAAAPSPRDDVITETREEAAPKAAPKASDAPRPAVKAAVEPKPAPEPKPTIAKPAASGDGARAKALLEGKAAPAAESSRFVVQVGAFADAGAARDTRAKAERLGLKTYTQVVETSAGTRIRVRIGPFTTRTEADKALASARGAGLTAAVLAL
jgi:DedD protein